MTHGNTRSWRARSRGAKRGPVSSTEVGDMTEPGATTSLEFTEEMKGFITFGEKDFRAAHDRGKDDETSFMFHLTIGIDDVDRFVEEPSHPGTASGWVECEDLGGQRPVERGWFNLFVDADDPRISKMLYRLHFTDGLGDPRTLVGYKEVRDDPGLDVWEDTSTLYTTIVGGHLPEDEEPAADITATGILRIHVMDFAQQMTTFRTSGPDAASRRKALRTFNKLFLGRLWDLYSPLVKDPDDAEPAE
jgi:cholesterol oxidase